MPSREEVFTVLEGELDYQAERWNAQTTPTEGRHTVAEFVLYMEDYLTEARTHLSRNGDPKASVLALDVLRKVTALGVQAMMQNGVVDRVNVTASTVRGPSTP